MGVMFMSEESVKKPDMYSSTNKINYYDVVPQIVEANKKSTISIKNKYITRYDNFKLGGEYFILISPMLDFEVAIKSAKEQHPILVEAANNELKFTYEFGSEQDYMLLVWKKDELSGDKCILLSTFIYALDEDLYSRVPLKGNTHLHSCYSDGLEEPLLHIGAALEAGFDYIALTDHNNYEGSVNALDFLNKLTPVGIGEILTILNGEEFSCNYQPMHIISLGADCAVPANYYWTEDEIPELLGETKKLDWIMEKLTLLCNFVHEHRGKVVICHPYWKPVFDWVRLDAPHSLLKRFITSGLIDAFEVIGGSPKGGTIICQEQYLLAMELMREAPRPYAILGQSDSHIVNTKDDSNVFATHYTITFSKSNSREHILEAIDDRYTVAVEETDGKCLYYGTLRLVNFCRFLEKHYFLEMKEERRLYYKIFNLCATGDMKAGEILSDALKKVKTFTFNSLKK